MAGRTVRVLLDQGPRGGEYYLVTLDSKGKLPEIIEVPDLPVPRGRIARGPAGYMPAGTSLYRRGSNDPPTYTYV
jgi:hypothetical protein